MPDSNKTSSLQISGCKHTNHALEWTLISMPKKNMFLCWSGFVYLCRMLVGFIAYCNVISILVSILQYSSLSSAPYLHGCRASCRMGILCQFARNEQRAKKLRASYARCSSKGMGSHRGPQIRMRMHNDSSSKGSGKSKNKCKHKLMLSAGA